MPIVRDIASRRLVQRACDPFDKTGAGGGGAGASIASAFVTIGNDAALTAERALAVTADLSLADGGANAAVTLGLANAGPGATGPIGDATHVAAVTIDAKGRITALTAILIAFPAAPVFVDRETPAGAGVNWTLAFAPVGGILLVRNGLAMKEGVGATVEEFQIAGLNITLGITLGASEWLRAWYRH